MCENIRVPPLGLIEDSLGLLSFGCDDIEKSKFLLYHLRRVEKGGGGGAEEEGEE